MPRILVTGIPQAEKEVIADFVVKELKRFKIKCTCLNADLEPPKNPGQLKGDVILTCTLVARSENGFRFTNTETIRLFNPDISILLELELRNPETRLWQELQRYHLVSSIKGELCILRMRRDNIKKPIREISDLLRKVF